jgi:hypothetical protein
VGALDLTTVASGQQVVLPANAAGTLLGAELTFYTLTSLTPVIFTSVHLTLSGNELDSNFVVRLYDKSGALLWGQASEHFVSG